jgi:hypothetical protein
VKRNSVNAGDAVPALEVSWSFDVEGKGRGSGEEPRHYGFLEKPEVCV